MVWLEKNTNVVSEQQLAVLWVIVMLVLVTGLWSSKSEVSEVEFIVGGF